MLEARNISRKNLRNEGYLLQNVSLSIKAGDRISITGPSGSGKTLLLRALAFLDGWDEGNLLWQGKPISEQSIPTFRSQVIYCHQKPILVGNKVSDNFTYPFRLGVHKEQKYDPEQIIKMFKALAFDASFLDKENSELSGGESQVVALIRAIQMDPQILLLDEPTSAMDPDLCARMETILCHWAGDEKRAWVWVSHSKEQAYRLSQEILTMNRAQLSRGEQ